MKKYLSILAAVAMASALAHAGIDLTGLYNTGARVQDDALNIYKLVPPGSGDRHYTIDAYPGSDSLPRFAVVSRGVGTTLPDFVLDNKYSEWISWNTKPGNGPAGAYTYELKFKASAAGQVEIPLFWSANGVAEIRLNDPVSGPVLATLSAGSAYKLWAATLQATVHTGVNSFFFNVDNGNSDLGKDQVLGNALRVQWNPVPEPPTYLAGMAALGLMTVFGWKLHSQGRGVVKIDHSTAQ